MFPAGNLAHGWWSEYFHAGVAEMTFSGASTSDLRHHLRQLRRSPAAWTLAILILVCEWLLAELGGYDSQPARHWFEVLGLSSRGFLAGEVWQVASYGLLHGGWWHAGLNAVFILLIGSRIEHMAGRRTMCIVVLAGVVAGGVFHLLIGSGLLVGISGGCMALLLFLTTVSPDSRMAPLQISGRSLGLGILMAAGILALADPAARIPGFSSLGNWIVENGWGAWFLMGHACHLGGGLAGWGVGRWMLRSRIMLKSLRRKRLRQEADKSSRA